MNFEEYWKEVNIATQEGRVACSLDALKELCRRTWTAARSEGEPRLESALAANSKP